MPARMSWDEYQEERELREREKRLARRRRRFGQDQPRSTTSADNRDGGGIADHRHPKSDWKHSIRAHLSTDVLEKQGGSA